MAVHSLRGRGLVGAPVQVKTPLGIFAVSGYANQTRAYSLKPAVKGGNGTRSFSLSAGTLPAGLSLNTTTGEISGTPTNAGTTSGLAITVTDPTGSAVSNTFSIVAGTAPSSITPSGDTTGATDIAAINAALSAGTSIVLSGAYYTNAPISQKGNTAIYADSGSLFLAAASNCQMWINTNQAAQTRTDQNMAVVGSANFFFNGNADNQVLQTNARINQGFTAISASNLKITGIKVQSRTGAFFMIGSTYCSMNTIELAQSTAVINSDGLDIGGGSSFIHAENFTGYVKDDCFSFFAKNKQSTTMMAAGTPWEAGADVTDIYINTISVDLGLANMFRLQAGNGFKLQRIFGKDLTNAHVGTGRFLIQTGEVSYLDAATNVPVYTDLSDIVIDGVTGFDNWLRADTSCSDIHVYNIAQTVPLQNAVASSESGAPTVRNITFDGVVDTSAGGHSTLVNATATVTYWNDVEFKNIDLSDLTTFVNSSNGLQSMVFENIAIDAGTPTLTSTKKSSGTFTNVTVAGVALDTAATFQSIYSGAFTDDFNRANEDLSAGANWLLLSGVSTGAQVASNVIKANDTASAGTAVASFDLGSNDHYVQAVNNQSSGLGSSFLCARLMDYNNYVGVRYNATNTQFEVYQRLGGTFTSLGTAADAAGAGKTMRLEIVGLIPTLKINGVAVLTASAVSPKIVSNRTGVNTRSVIVANWIDSFECGALA